MSRADEDSIRELEHRFNAARWRTRYSWWPHSLFLRHNVKDHARMPERQAIDHGDDKASR
jgi:hypothetical protein